MAKAAQRIIPSYAASLSVRAESPLAAKEAAERAVQRMGDARPDLAFLFLTAPHAPRAGEIAALVGRITDARYLVTMSASGVIGGGVEVESGPGISLLLASMPGVNIRPFLLTDLPRVPDQPSPEWFNEVFAPAMHIEPGHAATFVFADPFSVPLVRTLPAMSRAGKNAPIIGSFASSGKAPGQNIIGLNDQMMTSGGLGVSISGDIAIDGVVSQGCKPIGPTMLVTKARDNVILELSGKKAVEALRDAVRGLSAKSRTALTKGMLLGRVINEYQERFGQGDFLIRGIKAIENANGAVISDDFFRVGQTVQLHVRDAESARGDLEMVLDAQKLNTKPDAGLLFTCAQRGVKLFGQPSTDASAVIRAFSPAAAGVEQAKSGQRIDVEQQVLPLAGAFSGGEIGPVGEMSYLHTMTAGLTLFRSDRPA